MGLTKCHCFNCKKQFKTNVPHYISSMFEYNLSSCPYCDYVGFILRIFTYDTKKRKQSKEVVLK